VGAWTFPATTEGHVRDLAKWIYGTDGSGDEPGVTVRVALSALCDDAAARDRIVMWGRTLCRRVGHGAGVALGEGVVVVSGAFAAQGGSAEAPVLGGFEGIVLEVHEMPRGLAEASAAALGDAVWIVGGEAREGRVSDAVWHAIRGPEAAAPAGADGTAVRMRVSLSGLSDAAPSWRGVVHAHWVLCARYHHDRPVVLGIGVEVVEGQFEPSGGTLWSPCLGVVDGVVLEVVGLPRWIVEGTVAEHGEAVTIVEAPARVEAVDGGQAPGEEGGE